MARKPPKPKDEQPTTSQRRAQARDRRLAESLRANLEKRKTQARARSEDVQKK